MTAWFRPAAPALALALAAWTAGPPAVAGNAAPPPVDLGFFAGAGLLLPEGPASSTVFLVSDAGGRDDGDAAAAEALRAGGAAVVAVDFDRLSAALAAREESCAYLVGDVERVSHEIGRLTRSETFLPPVIAGRGAGGALAIAALVQSPEATVGAAVAVDPAAALPLGKPLCTAAGPRATPAGPVYDLRAGPPPAPLTVILTPDAARDGGPAVAALAAGGSSFALDRSRDAAPRALEAGAAGALETMAEAARALPLTELPATPSRDVMAIILSGDGGWRDIDRQVATALQADGVPVVGLDALRWFWSRRSPAETAAAIDRIARAYRARWGVRRVLLAGYSFGASVIPAAWAALPAATRADVAQISLLAPGDRADWEISVGGWLGGASSEATPVGPDLAKLPGALVQCFHGREETDSACAGPAPAGMEEIETDGGHHFDGDYQALAARILAGLDARRARAAND